MLKKYIQDGFGIKEDLNCSEQILYGANHVYNLGLSDDCLRLSAGFGGGMAAEDACGVVTGASMVFSRVFVEERCRTSPHIREVNAEFNRRFKELLKSTNCKELKDMYRREEGCKPIIVAGAGIIDDLLEEYGFNKKGEV